MSLQDTIFSEEIIMDFQMWVVFQLLRLERMHLGMDQGSIIM
jgi:hypothetical protein